MAGTVLVCECGHAHEVAQAFTGEVEFIECAECECNVMRPDIDAEEI